MLLLLTNDDGIDSEGLQVLASALEVLGDIVVVAPHQEMSAVGHALTLQRPLRAKALRDQWFAVDGTPTDCVYLGVHGLIQKTPDLIVSGINLGTNLGDDVMYSGTVAAAMEAAMMGVPSMAISLDCQSFELPELERAATIGCQLARGILHHGLPADTFLNVNIPGKNHRGIRVTYQGRRRYSDAIACKTDPRGKAYYWIGSGGCPFESRRGSDSCAVEEGFVSVTPLHLDLTNYNAFEAISRWCS